MMKVQRHVSGVALLNFCCVMPTLAVGTPIRVNECLDSDTKSSEHLSPGLVRSDLCSAMVSSETLNVGNKIVSRFTSTHPKHNLTQLQQLVTQ
jgi:hypothetical protein